MFNNKLKRKLAEMEEKLNFYKNNDKQEQKIVYSSVDYFNKIQTFRDVFLEWEKFDQYLAHTNIENKNEINKIVSGYKQVILSEMCENMEKLKEKFKEHKKVE